MTEYLFDTNHASAVLNNTNAGLVQPVASLSGIANFGISMPSIAELWYMVYNSAKIPQNTIKLNGFLKDLRYWDFAATAAEEFGRMKTQLRKSGRPIPDMDVQIAAIARVNNLIVITADAHFGFITNLQTEIWT